MGVFVSLSKAFDMIMYTILRSKVCSYGLRGVPLKLLESYLCNRKKFVEIKGKSSHMTDVTSGVPQGTVL